jgi:ketosteroid isomerase-like protein
MLSGFLRVLCVIFAIFAVKSLFEQFRSGGVVSTGPDLREMSELVLYFFAGDPHMRLAGVCTVLLCAAGLAMAQESDASIQGKIIALEKLWNQAYKSADTKALDSILDDSIVLINDDGSIQTKKEFLASVKASNAQEQQVAPEALKVNVHGNVAIASGVLRVKGVEGGKPYTRRERFVDTWLHKGENWVCIATNATPIH